MSKVQYQVGRLIQYSYHQDALELWDGQTIFASKPIALEAPSASFLLTWEIVLALQNKGVQVVSLLHAAGISSTGEENLDQLLPLPEYFEIPQAAVDIINTAKQENRGVIALGTSVTRALESAAMQDGEIRPGSGITTLLLSPTYNRKIVTGLITGMHEDGTSHLQLLQSFAPWKLIEKAYSQAKNLGYLWHEYGDACLILA
jgi:S-adenosylmethionine:tRNA ribosyltransferase-isomerase